MPLFFTSVITSATDDQEQPLIHTDNNNEQCQNNSFNWLEVATYMQARVYASRNKFLSTTLSHTLTETSFDTKSNHYMSLAKQFVHAKAEAEAYNLLKLVMLVNSFWDIPSATHTLRKHHQVTGTKLHRLIGTFRVNLHLPFQKVTCLFRWIRPWKFARITSPPITTTHTSKL